MEASTVSDTLETPPELKPAPSFITYLLGIAVTFMAVSALQLLFLSLTSGTVQANRLIQDAGAMGFATALTFVEIFFLRRNLQLLGGFGLGVTAEIAKIGTAVFLVSFDTTIHMLLYAITLVSLFVSRFFRSNLDQVSQAGISRNILNILPTILILTILTGGSFLTNLGFGALSQAQDPQEFDVSDIDFNQFNTPSWNAGYFLDNILDQFTSGLQFPEEIIFNVTNLTPDPSEITDQTGTPSQKPVTYFRQQTFDLYEYRFPEARSASWFSSNTQSRIGGLQNLYSENVPKSFEDELFEPGSTQATRQHNTALLQFRMGINHSSTFGQNQPIPTVWNGQFGALVPLFDDSQEGLSGISIDGRSCLELSCQFLENSFQFENVDDVASVEFAISNIPEESDDAILEYQMRYLQPNFASLSAFSLGRSDSAYEGVFSNPDDWTAIKVFYTQEPSIGDGTMPNCPIAGCYLGHPDTGFESGLNNITNYEEWAPELVQLASRYNDTGLTVFNQALALTQALAPETGAEGLVFDQDLWLSDKANTEGVHPEPEQDYVDWFLRNKGGISMHFASTLTMALRLMDIPARTVTGYAGGNSSIDTSNQWRVVTAYWTHAWTEVLVPLQIPAASITQLEFDRCNVQIGDWPTGTCKTHEWVTFDPFITALLGSSIDGGVNSESRPAFLDPFAYNQSIPVGATGPEFDNFAEAFQRVGVDQDGDLVYNPAIDTGVISHNFATPTTLTVGVYTASVNSINGIPASVIGIPNANVTFQLIKFDDVTNQTVALPWDPTDPNVLSVTVKSSPTNFTATATLTWDPFSAQGVGEKWIIAIHGDSTVAQGAPIGAFSDRDHTDDTIDFSDPNNPFDIDYSPLIFCLVDCSSAASSSSSVLKIDSERTHMNSFSFVPAGQTTDASAPAPSHEQDLVDFSIFKPDRILQISENVLNTQQKEIAQVLFGFKAKNSIY